MITQKIKYFILQLLCCFCAVYMYGQEYKSKAALNAVPKSGFYAIDITPQLAAYLQKDFADLKIIDADGKPVQYIVNTANNVGNPSKFIEFPIISYNTDSAKNSILIVKNELTTLQQQEKTTVTEITLFIKNTSVTRNTKISGSNDGKTWYIIENNISIENKNQTAENYYLNTIRLSKTDYLFYKIEIENKKDDPYNILKAGVILDGKAKENPENNYSKILKPTLLQNDSNNKSYIKLNYLLPYHVEKVKFFIAGQSLYERNVKLFLSKSDIFNDNSFENFTLSSKSNNEFSIAKINTKEFYFVIDNKDNAALKIDSIQCYQKNISVIANLEKGKQYTLLLQNDKAIKPEYDLEKFRDSIPSNLESVGYSSVVTNNLTEVAPKSKNNNWVWITIIIALLVLGFLTKALLADMKKKNL